MTMRWSYKTIHYELKKEGLLGSAFLDEPEIELSLNQYGKAGWELVSLLETMDGLIAVFKQPLDLDTRSFASPVKSSPEKNSEPAMKRQRPMPAVDQEFTIKQDRPKPDREVAETAILDEFEIVEEKAAKSGGKPLVQPADVGSIRIE
jgi:hypothetical protein